MEENVANLPMSDEFDIRGFGRVFKGSPKKSDRLISRPALDEYYDTSNRRRGIALVFCQMNFETMAKRQGTDKDREDICEELNELDFDVRVFDDLNRKKLLDTLKDVSKEDHTDNDCLVVVVMTHGEQGVLYASDSKYNVDSLWKNFVGDACPSLIGKPKLIFIQACRGEQFDDGVSFKAAPASNVVKDFVDSRNEPVVYAIPAMADLLVMYSTYEGYYSWRNPRQGSWFIQSLCRELTEHGKQRDLLTLLTGVIRRTAFEYQSFVPHDERMDCKKQIPCMVSMLTKTFYFTKKTRSKVVTAID
ncbi:caspase-like [Uranotaenia lowii]|uniref:caspase-like n=1 Tax=Uranotaenia lowii TaxID=190385 RepID=UPI002478AA91|nr:caspase-like [Uranotaenia lowii]